MMKTIVRYFLIYLALTSNVNAIVLGTVDEGNIYSSVGYTLTTSGAFGSVVALDPNWVLTAAHVVANLGETDSVLLIMGDPNTGAEGAYIADQIITHPSYSAGEFHDDLALIHIIDYDPIVPTPGVVDASFATLSNVSLTDGLPATATLTGYGLTSIDGTVDPNEPILRRYADAATDPFGPSPSVDPGFPYDCSLAMFLCTFDTSGGAPGDSGGAMWLDYGGGKVVAGINSFIFDENDLLDSPQTPDWTNGYWTVATSTAYYQDWITNYVPDALFGSSAVPLPSAVWLLVSGLLGLTAIARRNKAA